jgi:hypothetical protein
MTEKMQADVPPSRQAGFVRCCLKEHRTKKGTRRMCPVIQRAHLQMCIAEIQKNEEK